MIRSPWDNRPEDKPTPFTGATKGRSLAEIQGFRYSIDVGLPLRVDAVRAKAIGTRVFGECLLILAKTLGEVFATPLRTQSLSLTERPVMGPCVEIFFGETRFYAAASSTNEERAQRLAIDRLAQVLLALRDARAGAILTEHHVTVLRNTQ